MWFYLCRRLVLAIAIIAIAVTLLFLMIRAVPGDPAAVLLGPRATPEMKALLHQQMGLDKPLVVQIATFFGGLLHGDLGFDVFSQRPVADIVFEQLPYTIQLILVSISCAVAIAVPLGCYSAMRRNSLVDQVAGVVTVATIAIPSFVVAVYALLIFAVTLRWLPAIGAGNGFWDGPIHLVLPGFAIGIGWVGYISRLVRASMLEVLGENHVRMARSFGISEWRIVARYALPLAILPTVTILGVGIAWLLSSAVFIEVVFARPGIGALIVNAVHTRNYPIVMGVVLVSTFLIVSATTLSDVINAFLDPRTREKL
ncbi:ABC transporter permease [Mesorhizobium sp. M7A.F.Ca.CA.001.09.2.1]|uniref:ABC transporter permease n=2 Tax=Mesorhizobium TaxID=68287 RepID=A0AB38TF73_9HYPH|nr:MULTISPECIES: ABC transporter permease [Mesorhizobium]RUY13216.1 ABC transporter permease [Mesorhizobium sp. M2A.F.Ca.ET.040.01.1.1]RUY56434.1 ABC transporter permease [Mesorhizobium sp. M7A.F.Ca.CA.001.13.2.1]MDF3218448.1 ABC transporter permease [Mesorhizobium ciceri]RUU25493.1 ABC transporter permease [Mesorhizobium sp. M6A.T.Ce.TU.016.01.1.1]RUY69777.1 ABC transporter permease [Mesorhizobium sp. M7A.F.Ca.CA.001.13.1.1]